MKLDKAELPGGATVAHLAFYLAEHLGCDPIIFVGQDLGFSDGLCYTPGTSYEDVWRPELSRFCTVEMKQWEQIVRERFILRRIPDQQGRPMYTEERLFTYLQQFERDFLQQQARVIDATEGGRRQARRDGHAAGRGRDRQFCSDAAADWRRRSSRARIGMRRVLELHGVIAVATMKPADRADQPSRRCRCWKRSAITSTTSAGESRDRRASTRCGRR